MIKRNLGRKEFISATLLHHGPSLKKLKQGKNLEAGAKAETTEELCLLACLKCYLLQQHAHSGLELTPQPSIKTMPYRLAYRPV